MCIRATGLTVHVRVSRRRLAAQAEVLLRRGAGRGRRTRGRGLCIAASSPGPGGVGAAGPHAGQPPARHRPWPCAAAMLPRRGRPLPLRPQDGSLRASLPTMLWASGPAGAPDQLGAGPGARILGRTRFDGRLVEGHARDAAARSSAACMTALRRAARCRLLRSLDRHARPLRALGPACGGALTILAGPPARAACQVQKGPDEAAAASAAPSPAFPVHNLVIPYL